MNHRQLTSAVALFLALVLPPIGQAADVDATKTNQPSSAAITDLAPPRPPRPVFKPHGTDSVVELADRRRGGARGQGISLTILETLTPAGTGLTTEESPVLFWYQSVPQDVPFELAMVVSDHLKQKVVEVKLPDARRAGIQQLNLADYHVKLEPNVEYEWVIALVVNPESRSKDVTASGFIKRIDAPPTLTSRLANARVTDQPAIYAAEGIWYDAFESLARLVRDEPANPMWRADEAALLEQVGLTNSANFVSSASAGK